MKLIKDLGMIYPTEKSSRKHRFGLYECPYCQTEFKAMTNAIKTNHTKSCGCLNMTHNLTNHRLYNTWFNMVNRCNNHKSKKYKDYGGRGIKVCDEWLDVKNFINDMDSTFQEGLSLDRINVNGNYEFNNCRWTTRAVQSRNTRLIRATNTSGYRGVSKFYNDWQTTITVNCKKIRLGIFKDKLEAARAYDNYVINNKLEHTLNFKGHI